MYRPPNSPTSHLNEFENIIGKMDSENRELCVLGDINIDLMQEPISANASKLNSILDVYGMDQLITEPTRITNNSQSLIDLCLTNIPSKIIKSGVNHISVSDHALIFMTYKTHFERTGSQLIKTQHLKNFNKENFLRDLEQKLWCDVISTNNDPNDMRATWKSLLMTCIDSHASLCSKRAGKKKSPWITSQLL